MATQGDKIKYRGYAYVKGKGGSGDSYTKAETDALLNNKQDNLTAGTGIDITDDVISCTATGDVTKAYVDTQDATLQANIDSEKTAREGGDATLQNNINTEKTARETTDGALQTAINNEATTRADADTALQTDINTNKGNITIVNNSLSTLKTDYETHKSQTDDLVSNLQTLIANESLTRQTKDSELETKITALEGDVKVEVVDSQPTTPVNNTLYFIKQADGTYIRKMYNNDTWYDMGNTTIDLSNYYTKDETYNRTFIDTQHTTLQTNINNEATTRAEADNTLLTNINNEVTERETKDTELEGRIATNETNITRLENDKQDKLYAGDHIFIGDNDVVECTLTAGDGIKIEDEKVNFDIDSLFPIGYVIVANQAPGLGTWTDITDTYTNRYLRLGTYGELSAESLPIPDVTISAAGDHTHIATANTTGAHTHDYSSAPAGTFMPRTATDAHSIPYTFSTGATTSAGDHTHTITVEESGSHTHDLIAAAGGVYQAGAPVQPLGFGIRIFQRTA